MSCNIKAPIQEILWEGNKQTASEIYLDQCKDTVNTNGYIRLEKVDSISSTTLKILPIKGINGDIVLKNSGEEKLHTIHLWNDGKKSTLIALNSGDTIHTELHFKSFLNNVLFVSGAVTHLKIIVIWQNTLLPERFIVTDQKGLSVFIPKEAKTIPESTLRIFVLNHQGKVERLSINLNAGEPLL